MSRTVRIPQLVFSTRSAEGTSGAGAVREVIAETPGIPPDLHSDFYRRADLVGSIARADLEQGAAYTFSPILAGGERRWLFCRTVAIGWYRGGNRLLTHGLVLKRSHLAALDGNPFLLEPPEPTSSPFRTDHPGSDRELPLLPVTLPSAVDARRRNRERFETLSRRLTEPALDAGFPSVFDSLLDGGHAGWVLDPPSAEVAEWLLLHLHLEDRQVLSFHTWYCHGRAVPYRLLLLPPSDVQETRRQFPDTPLVEGGVDAPPERTPGVFAQKLRRRSPAEYHETMHRYRLTFLATGGEHPPLSAYAASVCLRASLGESLSEEDEHLRQRLLRRVEKSLEASAAFLASLRQSDPARLPEAAAAEAELHTPPPAAALDELVARQRSARLEKRWALLFLLTCDTGRGPLATVRGRAAAWRELAAGSERELLSRLDPSETPILYRYLRDLAATSEGDGSGLSPLVAHLLTSQGTPQLAEAPGANETAALLSATASAVLETSTDPEALPANRWRAWLDATAPGVGFENTSQAGDLLAACAVAGREDLLERAAEHIQGAAQDGLEDPLRSAVTHAVSRLETFAQRADPRRPHSAFVQGLTLLLRTCRTADPVGEASPHPAWAEALSTACFAGLVHLHRMESRAEQPPPLREEWLNLLERFSMDRLLETVLTGPDWINLLEDDLIRCPLGTAGRSPANDPRLRVLNTLAWQRWSRIRQEEGGDSRSLEGRLLRLGQSQSGQLLGAAHGAVAPHLLAEARRLLTFDPMESDPSRGEHDRP